jgi:hypothetical protein
MKKKNKRKISSMKMYVLAQCHPLYFYTSKPSPHHTSMHLYPKNLANPKNPQKKYCGKPPNPEMESIQIAKEPF